MKEDAQRKRSTMSGTTTRTSRHHDRLPDPQSRPQPSGGRRLRDDATATPEREMSPGKTVHFPPLRDLVVGPSGGAGPSRTARTGYMTLDDNDIGLQDEDTPTKQLLREQYEKERRDYVRFHRERFLELNFPPNEPRPSQVNGVYGPLAYDREHSRVPLSFKDWDSYNPSQAFPPTPSEPQYVGVPSPLKPRDVSEPYFSRILQKNIHKPLVRLGVQGVLTDEELCRRIHDLQTQIVAVAAKFHEIRADKSEKGFANLLKKDNETLVDYINYIADGGPGGKEGWIHLLTTRRSRDAVVIGVISKALRHMVFDQLYFGADEELAERLRIHEVASLEKDGFVRARERAQIINESERHNPTEGTAALSNALGIAGVSIITFIQPLFALSGHDLFHYRLLHLDKRMHAIVAEAAALSRAMRRHEDAVYHWLPTSKDEEFAFHTMDCLNLDEMVRSSPFETAAANPAAPKRTPPHNAEAIVRVVCSQALVVYRPGGGKTAERQLSGLNPSLDRGPNPAAAGSRPAMHGLTEGDGFRSRLVSKSLVLLEWGRQGRLTREAGTLAHLEAMDAHEEKESYAADYAGRRSLYSLWQVANDPMPPRVVLPPLLSALEMSIKLSREAREEERRRAEEEERRLDPFKDLREAREARFRRGI